VLHKLNSAVRLIQRTTTEVLDDDYELYRIGRSQENDQLLRESRHVIEEVLPGDAFDGPTR
jgi:hypothetical protein